AGVSKQVAVGSNTHPLGVRQDIEERRSAAQLLQEGTLPLLLAFLHWPRGVLRKLGRKVSGRQANADVCGLNADSIVQEVAEGNCLGNLIGSAGILVDPAEVIGKCRQGFFYCRAAVARS